MGVNLGAWLRGTFNPPNLTATKAVVLGQVFFYRADVLNARKLYTGRWYVRISLGGRVEN